MSTLKTTYIQHPSAASPNLELKADGTLALPLSGIGDLSDVDEGSGASDGDVLTYDGVGNVWVPESIVFPAGIGSNVVQTVKTDEFSTTSTSFVDVTGFTVTITPSSATAKVLIIASWQQGHSVDRGEFQVLRDATVLGKASFVDFYGNTRPSAYPTFVYLDSPATTSAVTYKLQGRTVSTGTQYFNRSGVYNVPVVCSITAIEVAA